MAITAADALHVLIEATKLAGADRRGMGGDPDFVDMPMKGLCPKQYAEKRRALIDMKKAVVPKFDPGNPAPMSPRIRRPLW